MNEANRVIMGYVESYRFCFSYWEFIKQNSQDCYGGGSCPIRCGGRTDRWEEFERMKKDIGKAGRP